jgi:Arc/MetJ-type ribon-helix-helix transcriptional regulator
MSTPSIHIPNKLEAFISKMIRKGNAPTKAEVVRQVLPLGIELFKNIKNLR